MSSPQGTSAVSSRTTSAMGVLSCARWPSCGYTGRSRVCVSSLGAVDEGGVMAGIGDMYPVQTAMVLTKQFDGRSLTLLPAVELKQVSDDLMGAWLTVGREIDRRRSLPRGRPSCGWWRIGVYSPRPVAMRYALRKLDVPARRGGWRVPDDGSPACLAGWRGRLQQASGRRGCRRRVARLATPGCSRPTLAVVDRVGGGSRR